MSKKIHYPTTAWENHIQGRAILKFVVNEDGAISDITVYKGVSKELDAEAMRVVRKMPKWKPGIQDDRPIKVFFTMPVTFKLQG